MLMALIWKAVTFFALLMGTQTFPTIAQTPSLSADFIAVPSVSMPSEFIHYQNKVIVLLYHHLDEVEANQEITITPDRFRKHLQALKDNHYQIIPMEQFIDFMTHGTAIPANAVVITFDDGYESFYRLAYPELKSFGYSATNFLIVSYVDSFYPQLPFLTWTEILEMKKNGFSFYSHTYNQHQKAYNALGELVPPLTNRLRLDKENRVETEEEYKSRIFNDLGTADQILRFILGNKLSLLCLPFGASNKTVFEIGKNIGIDYFFTIQEGINSSGNKEIFRVQAGTRYISADGLLQKLMQFH